MFRHHQSPRHLDDPLRPVFGLSVAQAVGVLLAIGAAFGAWQGLGRLPIAGHLLTEVRIFAAGAVAALVFFAVYALAGDRTEPYARQLWAFARRSHHYAPSPLLTSLLEDEYDQETQPATSGQRQLQPSTVPTIARGRRSLRRSHRR